jgi:hypothetical protein
MTDLDHLVKAIYARRAIRDREIKSWECLSEYAREYWRGMVRDMLTAQEELRASKELEAEVTG